MKYIEFKFKIYQKKEFVKDVLISQLGELGFESFIDTKTTDLKNEISSLSFNSYIQKDLFSDSILPNIPKELFGTNISYIYKDALDKDWNKEWEKNSFKPININGECIIHSTNHIGIPKVKYDILINPKLSFGSGHHETTSMILKEILELRFDNKDVLDMGCGTAVLSILASMRGAKYVQGIDIDTWSVNNATENVQLNKLNNIDIIEGNAESLKSMKNNFDVIFANINMNILIADMDKYVYSLKENGTVFFSGFYNEDLLAIIENAKKYNLEFQYKHLKNNWVLSCFKLK